MRLNLFPIAALLLAIVHPLPTTNAAEIPAVTPLERAPALHAVVDQAVAATLTAFAKQALETNQLAVTLVDLSTPGHYAAGSYRGTARIYPASVIKLFYLAAAHRWMEDSRIEETAELRRAMRDMIVESYNEATHYIVDLLTGTTSGPELPAAQMDDWKQKRNAVNRYFASLAYTNINANQKPWCEGPYGRERIFVGKNYDNRNMLTTDDTARLLCDIATSQAVTPKRSEEMMRLLLRDSLEKSAEETQANGYTGRALPTGGRLWSKAGWTSQVRHDAACVELPGGKRFVLVTFTVGHSNEREVIPTLAREVFQRLK